MKALIHPHPPTRLLILWLAHGMRPSELSCVAIMTSAANQMRVSQAACSSLMSSQVSTPVRSRIASPTSAATVADRSNIRSPTVHSTSRTVKAKSMSFSAVVIGPISASRRRASPAACGVDFTSGGYTR